MRILTCSVACLLVCVAACSSGDKSRLDGSTDLCDTLTAHPNDPHKPSSISGVLDDRKIEAKRALEACAAALNANPRIGRLQFQYGRALLAYGSKSGALAHFRQAAVLGHGLSRRYHNQVVAQRARETRSGSGRARDERRGGRNRPDLEREIPGILAIGAGLLAAGRASDAAAANTRARPVPRSSTPAQCSAIVRSNVIYCSWETVPSGYTVGYRLGCNTRWKNESRACGRTGVVFPNPGTAFYCDPASRRTGDSAAEVVAAACPG